MQWSLLHTSLSLRTTLAGTLALHHLHYRSVASTAAAAAAVADVVKAAATTTTTTTTIPTTTIATATTATTRRAEGAGTAAVGRRIAVAEPTKSTLPLKCFVRHKTSLTSRSVIEPLRAPPASTGGRDVTDNVKRSSTSKAATKSADRLPLPPPSPSPSSITSTTQTSPTAVRKTTTAKTAASSSTSNSNKKRPPNMTAAVTENTSSPETPGTAAAAAGATGSATPKSRTRHQHLEQPDIERLVRGYCRWQQVDKTQPVAQARGRHETAVSVMSFNILAQTNLDSHPKLYRHCNPDHLAWPYRVERVMRQITEHDCDIVCLQEVQESHLLDAIVPRMARAGYQFVYKGKTGDKIEGCAIFWREAAFSLVRWSSVEMRVPNCRVLNRDNVGLVAVVSPRADPRAQLVVATTHLLFNPRRGEVKLAQLRYLIAEVERLAFLGTCEADMTTPVYMPVVLCGDLNSLPFSPLYQFVVDGKLGLDGLLHSEIAAGISTTAGGRSRSSGGREGPMIMPGQINVGNLLPCTLLEDTYIARYGLDALATLEDAFAHSFVYHLLGEFGSCYSHRKRDAAEVTSFIDEPATVDYIFFQRSRLLRHVATLGVMTRAEMESVGGLPNAAMGSDHIPVAAKFILRPIPADALKTGL